MNLQDARRRLRELEVNAILEAGNARGRAFREAEGQPGRDQRAKARGERSAERSRRLPSTITFPKRRG